MRLIICIFIWAGAAQADPGHWRVSSALQARSNSLGIGLLTFSGYRVALSDSDHLLLANTYVEAGVRTQLSPASFHPGAYVEVVPVAPIMLRLSALKLGYFGLFGTVVEYDGPDADWSPDTLDRAADRAEPAVGTAWEAMAMLRLKFGPVLALHEQRYAGVFMERVSEEQGFWYESINDLLVARSDRVHTMKATLAYLVSGSVKEEFLILGGQWERYSAQESGATRQIVGAVGLWRPDAGWWGRPAFAALVGAMVEDVHRQGSPYFGGQALVSFGGP